MHFYTIRNTSNDRTKTTLHRAASGFTPEVSIGGTRLSPGYQMNVNPEHFERIKEYLTRLYENGSVEVFEGKTEEGAPDVRFMMPELAPAPESNPHGVYNPLKREEPMPLQNDGPYVPPTSKEEADALEARGGSPSHLTWPPQPPVITNPNPVPGEVLAHDLNPPIHPGGGAPTPRPPIEQAVLPGEVLARESHVQAPGVQEESTRPAENSPPAAGEGADQIPQAPGPSPSSTEPRRAENPGGKKKKLM